MSPLRPTQHIERVPALRHTPSAPARSPRASRSPVSFGTALVVAVVSTFLVTLGVARIADATAATAIEAPAATR
ncbi:MAG: hypothetical protein JO180_09685 [Gemmatirosa sp.]|nr:hypothetical protein [Gemmatirosa sp.]